MTLEVDNLVGLPYWRQREIVKKYWDMRKKKKYYVVLNDEKFYVTESQRLLLTYIYFYGKSTYSQLADILFAIGRRKKKKKVVIPMMERGLLCYDGLYYHLTDKGRRTLRKIIESVDWMDYDWAKKEIDMVLDRELDKVMEEDRHV